MKNVTAKGSQQAIKEERAELAKKAAARRAKNVKKKER
jgi:hypothetical protein